MLVRAVASGYERLTAIAAGALRPINERQCKANNGCAQRLGDLRIRVVGTRASSGRQRVDATHDDFKRCRAANARRKSTQLSVSITHSPITSTTASGAATGKLTVAGDTARARVASVSATAFAAKTRQKSGIETYGSPRSTAGWVAAL
jgi:hypothetical protein